MPDKKTNTITERINIYLDDLRICPEGFVIARTYEEAVSLLENNKVGILSLDHDLGEDASGDIRKSGYDLVKYICENDCDIEEIYIHTDNSVGRANMLETLKAAIRRGFITRDIKLHHYPLVPNRYE